MQFLGFTAGNIWRLSTSVQWMDWAGAWVVTDETLAAPASWSWSWCVGTVWCVVVWECPLYVWSIGHRLLVLRGARYHGWYHADRLGDQGQQVPQPRQSINTSSLLACFSRLAHRRIYILLRTQPRPYGQDLFHRRWEAEWACVAMNCLYIAVFSVEWPCWWVQCL